jgi:hypothetical protein
MTDTLAKTRLAQLAADEGGAFEKVAVPKALLRRLLALLETPQTCAQCDHHTPYDVVAHESLPSRANPIAAAAAVNMLKAGV